MHSDILTELLEPNLLLGDEDLAVPKCSLSEPGVVRVLAARAGNQVIYFERCEGGLKQAT